MFSTASESAILLLMACQTTAATSTKKTPLPSKMPAGDRPNCRTAGGGGEAGGQGGQQHRGQQQSESQLHLPGLTAFAHQKAGK